MAVIHQTTMVPTKLELLTTWLPTRPWYRGTGRPVLRRAGGFRLDDPAGAVGIEFLVIVDGAGVEPVGYLVPFAYRGAPLDDAEEALVGTSMHGVLGQRWLYDGTRDPVVQAQIAALVAGTAEPQAQHDSGKPDPSIRVTPVELVLPAPAPAVDGDGHTDIGDVVRVHRVLRPEAVSTAGQVSVPWQLADGVRVRSVALSTRPGVG
ncbi:1,4-alpha-glucan branching protein [Nocardia brasiliensis]|uniref:1,4-alpha-glucan branching protein n=1 Tax=Nocardia brasiliensis TaxID=37326 RepID=A0A6G9XSQ2_NOCBR|nr:1,4-alpha-glucan branching protein [Nocardia brasiliensis]QIS03954.1 1,4-alpha-glucan branching protein [Nocardia brasiliensis]